MTNEIKALIGQRLRQKREQSGYTRERLGELCSLSPRFIANIELGDSSFSLDSLMIVCRVLSCSSDELLFGKSADDSTWDLITEKLRQLDGKYCDSVGQAIQSMIETIVIAESGKE